MKYLLAALMFFSFAAAAQAKLHTETIEYKLGDTTLEGYLAYDDSVRGKRPGVLVVHEWWGLNDYIRNRTEQLAQLGYTAFAADIYGKGVRAKTMEEAGKLAGIYRADRQLMRERVDAGLDVLIRNRSVDPRKIAAIGYCFGGGVVLELARSGADLKGVVSFHGLLDTPNSAENRNIRAKVLVLHGALDPFVKPGQVMTFWDDMNKTGADWQINIYSGAVHGFTNPDSGNDKSKGMAYNPEAARRSWEAMKLFFSEIFR